MFRLMMGSLRCTAAAGRLVLGVAFTVSAFVGFKVLSEMGTEGFERWCEHRADKEEELEELRRQVAELRRRAQKEQGLHPL